MSFIQNEIRPAVAGTPAAFVPAPLPPHWCWRVTPGFGAPIGAPIVLPVGPPFGRPPPKTYLLAQHLRSFLADAENIELISDCGDLHKLEILQLHASRSAWEHHLWWTAPWLALGAPTPPECSLFFALDTDFIIRSSLFCGSDASNQGYIYIWKCRELFFVCVRLLDYDRNYVVDRTTHVGICGDHPSTWSLYNIPAPKPTGSSSRQQK